MNNGTDQEQLRSAYQAGKQAFERGRYRESVDYLKAAMEIVLPNSKLGGEIQMWLATAYEAAGERNDAIALCRALSRHPHWETRKQSRRLLYILEAPRLATRPDWLVKIPDLGQLDGSESEKIRAALARAPKPKPKEPEKPGFVLEPEDLSQVNTRDNLFVWVALGTAVLVLGGLVWFS